jgi:hypothetical protein
VSSVLVSFLLAAVGSHQLQFAVVPAELFHLLHSWLRLQIGLDALF